MNVLFSASVCCVLFSSLVFSQQSPHDVAERIASFIQSETKNQIMDRQAKNVITKLDPSAVDTNVQFASSFNDWNYPNGVMLYGMIACGESKYSIRSFDFLFRDKEDFKNMWNQFHSEKEGTEYRLHRMESLDDCGAMGVALIEAYRLTGNKQWHETIDTIANYIHTKQTRLADGDFMQNRT